MLTFENEAALVQKTFPDEALEVVVPRGTPQRLIEQFVASHLEWIATRVARARAKARPPEAFPPTLLHLAAIGEHWQLQWVAGAGRARVRLDAGPTSPTSCAGGLDVAAARACRSWQRAKTWRTCHRSCPT